MSAFTQNSDPIINDDQVDSWFFPKVYPMSNKTGTAFSGTVQFQFSQNAFFVPSKSYLYAKVKLCRTDASGVEQLLVNTSGIYININPVANLFSTYTHTINSVQATRVDNFAQEDTLNKRLTWSKQVKETWAYASLMDASGATRNSSAGYLTSLTNVIPFKFSSGIFQSELMIPNAMHQIDLQIDPNYKYAFVQNASGTTYDPTALVSSYKVSVDDLYLVPCFCLNKSAPVYNGSHYIPYSASETSFQAITSTTNQLSFTVPPSTNKANVFFQTSLAGSSNLYSKSRFTDGSGAVLLLTRQPRINIGPLTVPSEDRNLAYSATEISGWSDSFYESVAIANDYVSDSYGNETYPEWLSGFGPVFSQSLERGDDRTTLLRLNTNFTSTPSNQNVWVQSVYDVVIAIQYQNGEVVSVSTETL